MCIRDRRYLTLFQALLQLTQLDIDDLLQLIPGERVEHDDLCLLYTSDAADDLLCVDLGGRRIITKKNPTHHRRLHPTTATPDL